MKPHQSKERHRPATEPSLEELFMKLSPAGRRAFFDRLLTDDFLITTAGWISEPADKVTWLSGLADRRLDEFDLRLVAVRRYGNVAVVLAESAQRGTRSGQRWEHTFRYTDVWRRQDTDWLLAVRHASAIPSD